MRSYPRRAARFRPTYSSASQPRLSSVIRRNDDLRSDAIQAPYLEDVLLDKGKPKSESQSHQHGKKQQESLPGQRQPGQGQIAQYADGGNRYVCNLGKRTVVHHAAIPLLIDRAGLRGRRVMHMQRPDPETTTPAKAKNAIRYRIAFNRISSSDLSSSACRGGIAEGVNSVVPLENAVLNVDAGLKT